MLKKESSVEFPSLGKTLSIFEHKGNNNTPRKNGSSNFGTKIEKR